MAVVVAYMVIPRFQNEAEERAFWESPKNDSTDYVAIGKGEAINVYQVAAFLGGVSRIAGGCIEFDPDLCAKTGCALPVFYQALVCGRVAEIAGQSSRFMRVCQAIPRLQPRVRQVVLAQI